MANKIEHRQFGQLGVVKRDGQGDEPALAGYAASFGTLSRDLGGFRERIQPGAFKRSLAAGDDCVMLQQHDATKVLGRRSAGTLTVNETPKGLAFRCTLDRSNSDHMNLYRSVQRGDICECSFAFTVPDGGDDFSDGVDENGQRCVIRTLRDVNLIDVSAVIGPAYDAPGATVVAARALDATGDEARKRRAADLLADIARQERAHEIGLQVLRDISLVSEKRGNQDFYAMRDQLKAAMAGYSYVGHTDDHVYGIDEDDPENDSVYRFGYQLDSEGHVTLDKDSRIAMRPADVSSVRCNPYAAFEERDLKFRMRAASGRTV